MVASRLLQQEGNSDYLLLCHVRGRHPDRRFLAGRAAVGVGGTLTLGGYLVRQIHGRHGGPLRALSHPRGGWSQAPVRSSSPWCLLVPLPTNVLGRTGWVFGGGHWFRR